MIGVVIGAVCAAIVATLAYRTRALTAGGAAAAFAVGTIVFGAGGWRGALVLFAFFIPSTLLSRIGRTRKRELTDAGKIGPRDARQVLANGGVAALCTLLALRGGATFTAAFAGAFAAASADTWGTEIGTLSRAVPRSIVTLRPVAAGLSGGITLVGTLATLAGAGCVALVGALAGVGAFWPVAAGGVAGAFVDSFLGASLQALRWCPGCARECETNPHRCGTSTVLRRGLEWLENDAINLAATLGGALVAGSLAAWIARAS
ncbi:MAG TPA: DUF92 domain-containing protein [Candidatus Tumulicola sp.]